MYCMMCALTFIRIQENFHMGSLKEVRLLRTGGGRFIEKITKTGLGGSYHVCTFAFLKKNAEIFKIKFYSYSPFFPLIIITVKIIKQIIMKDNNIQSCQ